MRHRELQRKSRTSSFLSCKFHLPHCTRHGNTPIWTMSNWNSFFQIHKHITTQRFIFVDFDARELDEAQFENDFDPTPITRTGKEVGHEFALFKKHEYEYDHTWDSTVGGTKYNWKTLVGGFQECSHRLTEHPTTLPKLSLILLSARQKGYIRAEILKTVLKMNFNQIIVFHHVTPMPMHHPQCEHM